MLFWAKLRLRPDQPLQHGRQDPAHLGGVLHGHDEADQAQLMDTESGAHVWSEHWDHPAGDVLAGQAKIADAAAAKLAAANFLSPDKAPIRWGGLDTSTWQVSLSPTGLYGLSNAP
jgi:hypothetical protein